jgi:cytidyltransferase-like protein
MRRLGEVCLFDLHDTLAEGRSPISSVMARQLNRLMRGFGEHYVGVTTGSPPSHLVEQVANRVLHPERLILLPQMGSELHVWIGGEWRCLHREELTDVEARSAETAIATVGASSTYPAQGPVIESRGVVIAYLPLGLDAPMDVKRTWDPDRRIRDGLADRLRALVPGMEVAVAGTSTVTISRRGTSKALCVDRLREMGFRTADILYFGDAFGVGRDDQPVMDAGVRCIGTRSPAETVQTLETLVAAEGTGRLVVVSGYFDPAHEGHLDQIEKAHEHGRHLIAIAGTEDQCDRKPGPGHGHHFHSWPGKVRVLRKYGADAVVPNIDLAGENGHLPCTQTILGLRPDVYAKGEDTNVASWPPEELQAVQDAGAEIVTGVGSRINRSSDFWRAVCAE